MAASSAYDALHEAAVAAAFFCAAGALAAAAAAAASMIACIIPVPQFFSQTRSSARGHRGRDSFCVVLASIVHVDESGHGNLQPEATERLRLLCCDNTCTLAGSPSSVASCHQLAFSSSSVRTYRRIASDSCRRPHLARLSPSQAHSPHSPVRRG